MSAEKEVVQMIWEVLWQSRGRIVKYRSVPHIRSPFCNLSASRKRRGGLYAGSDILSHEYAPSSSATPRC